MALDVAPILSLITMVVRSARQHLKFPKQLSSYIIKFAGVSCFHTIDRKSLGTDCQALRSAIGESHQLRSVSREAEESRISYRQLIKVYRNGQDLFSLVNFN